MENQVLDTLKKAIIQYDVKLAAEKSPDMVRPGIRECFPYPGNIACNYCANSCLAGGNIALQPLSLAGKTLGGMNFSRRQISCSGSIKVILARVSASLRALLDDPRRYRHRAATFCLFALTNRQSGCHARMQIAMINHVNLAGSKIMTGFEPSRKMCSSNESLRRSLEAAAVTQLYPLVQAANYVLTLVEIDAHTFDHPFLLFGYSGSVNTAGTICPSLSFDAGLVLKDTPISLIEPPEGRQAIFLAGQTKDAP